MTNIANILHIKNVSFKKIKVLRIINKKKMSESERFAHMFDKSIGLVRKWSEIRVGLMAA